MQHQHNQALNTLRQAITLAEPEGYIRLFVDEGEELRLLLDDLQMLIRRQPHQRLDAYLSKLLAAFPASAAMPRAERPQPGSQVLVEPLTARELEILRLLASGASNQQIADRLVIGIGTVKAHLNHIFGKLHARNRVDAIAKARKLGLIDQI
jgi:LuxR family maltose regulon positive regulatory protein